MASLSNLAAFHSPSPSRKLGCSYSYSYPLRSLHPNYPHRNQSHPVICASVPKRPRGSGRRAKSNADLFNDVKEFLSQVGFPHDHVPSIKELSQHGRQDLANIVRRRGYKFMKELLATSTETKINGSSSEENLRGKLEVLNDCQGVSTGQNEEVKDSSNDISMSVEATKLKDQEIDLAEDDDDSMSSEASNGEVNVLFVEDASSSHGAVEANALEGDITYCGPESSIHPSLQEKVDRFIRDGKLDNIGDSGFEFSNKRSSKESKQISESQSATESNSGTTHLAGNDLVLYGAEVINGITTSSSHQVEHGVLEMNPSRIESLSTEEVTMVNFNEDLEVEAKEMENQMEVNHLKFILHQKELELTQLKKQIEKEKLALSMFQMKADKEISEAQKVISEKDAELHATEESLSDLKEVEIQFWSEGEVVEVAGSFNGWHQRIKMDSEPSSSISVTSRSRKSQLWRTLLWLYPGVYEIKFVVDGHWTVDSQTESITRGTIHNNILRVDRG